jgi:hypothetical protein
MHRRNFPGAAPLSHHSPPFISLLGTPSPKPCSVFTGAQYSAHNGIPPGFFFYETFGGVMTQETKKS